ncbi:YdeI/OmpD-associated family protein [Flavisolibacter ginsenosidimutans]|uniref:YdeI/OmpD-associated family protein n=1 Tax=Flavisolibacter ginsenosidimutans TaxID=661481 RepID=A0A5B8UDR3_9BACT|nr:YdeI/OmpD-associated family protein [Flavisolibacter ginsenosidimutans]QEC54704.1 YdeI/OmpD-associated family protein [Flavisolibacter ginsenosidimutans]
MPSSTAQKLKIKEGYTLLTVHAPSDFKTALGELPKDVKLSGKTKTYNQIHWFVKDKAQVEEEVENIVALLKEGVVCWIYYPKSSSKMQTDLTRDKGWEALLRHEELQWISLVSFNETWSVFGMRTKTEADKKKETKPKERAVFNYLDAATKTVYLPEDFSKLLDKTEKEKTFFNTLSFSNKKEYVEWIVSAKREETRQTRVKESLERLGKGWKNPSNR